MSHSNPAGGPHVPSPLICAEELHSRLGDPNVKVFDVRGTWNTPARALPEEYDAGHIPGAVFLDWTKVFVEQGVPIGQASVADETQATESFRSHGIHAEDLVVVYDDYFHMQAGRIWWAMRYWGFENVRVLNGGWGNWQASGRPVSTERSVASEGTFKPINNGMLRKSLEEFIAQKDSAYVVDARGPISYAGSPDDPRTGHIPGAISVPFKEMLDEETGLFLKQDEIVCVFDNVIPDWRDANIISSCGSGYAGTVPMLALWDLGVSSSLYDGSMSEWKQDPERPVEQL